MQVLQVVADVVRACSGLLHDKLRLLMREKGWCIAGAEMSDAYRALKLRSSGKGSKADFTIEDMLNTISGNN